MSSRKLLILVFLLLINNLVMILIMLDMQMHLVKLLVWSSKALIQSMALSSCSSTLMNSKRKNSRNLISGVILQEALRKASPRLLILPSKLVKQLIHSFIKCMVLIISTPNMLTPSAKQPILVNNSQMLLSIDSLPSCNFMLSTQKCNSLTSGKISAKGSRKASVW